MKKFIAIVFLAALFVGCNTPASNSPKSVVASFVEAAKKGDIDGLKKYITSQDVSLMAMGETFLAKMDPAKAKEMKDKMSNSFRDKTKDASIDIKDEKINGSEATVNVDFTLNGKTESHPFLLQKEEGVWKISLLSTGMSGSGMSQEKMQDAMSKMNEGLKDLDALPDSVKKGVDELKKINTDSLRELMKNGNIDVEKLKEVLKAGKQ